jgi:preprotein translocase subunit SecB
MAEENQAAEGQEQQQPQIQFGLQRLYLKDLSFEAPQGVQAFTQDWEPQVQQELNNTINKLDENNHEAVLHITITVKLGDKVAFLAEVQQAGLFATAGMNEQQIAHAMSTAAPAMLFPYAREALDNIIVKGSFPALMIPPVNFDALFAQAVQKAKADAQQNAEAPESVQ